MSTKIQWAEESWNPVIGCSKVSEGCRNCYAERMAGMAKSGGNGRTNNYPLVVNEHGRWNGSVICEPTALKIPLLWKKPRRVFVNSMSDLFHEDVPDRFIEAVLYIVFGCRRHEFLVLTKRPERMYDFFRRSLRSNALPNLWLGVSAENQATLTERLQLLLHCPAAVRWVSLEPLLAPANIIAAAAREALGKDFWVVVGGESGPMARPFNLDWARKIINQCRLLGVPVFVKQLGGAPFDSGGEPGGYFSTFTQWANKAASWIGGMDVVCVDATGALMRVGADFQRATWPVRWHQKLKLRDKKGGNPEEWPEDLRVREYPNG